MAYTAELRMPVTTTLEERQERVNYLLELMRIKQSSHVLVGDTRFKGVSGGERKRLCIAMELLTKPLLLFLDEYSSGKWMMMIRGLDMICRLHLMIPSIHP